jgi:hypothetical protein
MAIVSAVCPSYVGVDGAHILCLSYRVWCGDMFAGLHTLVLKFEQLGWGTQVSVVCVSPVLPLLLASFPHSLSTHLLTFQAVPISPCPLLQYIQEVWGFIIVIMGEGVGRLH